MASKFKFITKLSIWGQALLTNLTTLLIVYFADESIFQDEIYISDLIYGLFALILVITTVACLAFIYIYRNQTPEGVLVDNKVLWLSVLVIGIAYTSGISTSSELASNFLDIVAVLVFYITGIRLLQMSENASSNEEKTQSAINSFFSIFLVSALLAVSILILSNFFSI